MSSKMADAATQTDIEETTTVATVAVTVPHPPPAPPAHPAPPANENTDTRPSRTERRQAFWKPIGTRIKSRREEREDRENILATRTQSEHGTSRPGSRGNAPRAGGRSGYHYPNDRRQYNGSQARSHVDNRRIPGPTYPQTPTRLRHTANTHQLGLSRDAYQPYTQQLTLGHFLAHEADGPSYAFMDNLRGQGRHSLDGPSHTTYPRQLQRQSPSSTTQVEDARLPALMVTPTDADGKPSWTRLVRDQAELDRSVLGITPPSPSIPSISQLYADDDLRPMSELHDAPLVPDSASSGNAPRFPNSDWDGETQIPDAQEQSKPRSTIPKALSSSEKLVEKLLSDMKEPALDAVERSWTFPGREIYLPSSVGFCGAEACLARPLTFLRLNASSRTGGYWKTRRHWWESL
jgi:hypothetical protein